MTGPVALNFMEGNDSTLQSPIHIHSFIITFIIIAFVYIYIHNIIVQSAIVISLQHAYKRLTIFGNEFI